VRRVLGQPGVTLIGIDDAKNRLLIGVEHSEARDRVEQELTELDIPREAVNLVTVGPIELDTSLNTRHRPLVGGLQIQFLRGTSPKLCTLGFIAIRRGVLGFVTNSHCSARRGRVGTVYSQPRGFEPPVEPGGPFFSQIGIETVDPRTRRSLRFLLGTVKFRNSDSNFSRLAGPDVIESPVSPEPDDPSSPVVSAALGFIARTPLVSGISSDPRPRGAWNGFSTFRITAERGFLATGTSVTKVGAVTGRTQGKVLLRTITLPTEVTPVLRSQYIATYVSEQGDSGAPVITTRAPGPTGDPIDASLAGIHWGNIPAFGGASLFSPIDGVQADLGPLNTCAPPLRC
jgi:hypothetical protein